MVGIAIVGCGSVAEEHVRSLEQLEGVEFGAYCDIVNSWAKDFLNRFGGTYATEDVARILSDDTIDALYVCTRNDTHGRLAVRTAEKSGISFKTALFTGTEP